MRHRQFLASSAIISLNVKFDADLRALVTPGTTLVLTNLPVNAGTKSAPGFDILTD